MVLGCLLFVTAAQANVLPATETLSFDPLSFVYTIAGRDVAGATSVAVPSTYNYSVSVPFWSLSYTLKETKVSGYDNLLITGTFGHRSNLIDAYTVDPFTLVLSATTVNSAPVVQYSYDFADGAAGALVVGSKAKAQSKEIKDYTFSVNAARTPLPAAVWLLGSGLASLVAFRRRLS